MKAAGPRFRTATRWTTRATEPTLPASSPATASGSPELLPRRSSSCTRSSPIRVRNARMRRLLCNPSAMRTAPG
ncbi:hypothetical protein RJ55_08272 [Drechmeria coniospora]|nr:hypothetical protein RJ55_08272 [Drechmeria coniospora]